MEISFQQIGTIHSCFKENFGIPRQAGLVPEAKAELELVPPYANRETCRDLEAFSHIWVIFVFHARKGNTWKRLVRPPRLGGNKKTGVFATRSSFRPNPIGLSAVKLERIRFEKNRTFLDLSGVDFLDQTQVIDIKPYISYADALPHTKCGFAGNPPKNSMKIEFTETAIQTCNSMEKKHPNLIDFITSMLKQDPRPAYYSGRSGTQSFGIKVYDFDVKWEADNNKITVTEITSDFNSLGLKSD